MRRPLRSWPEWLLHAVLRFGVLRGLWSDVWIEFHERAREAADAAARDATNDDTGPWMVQPPRGMH